MSYSTWHYSTLFLANFILLYSGGLIVSCRYTGRGSRCCARTQMRNLFPSPAPPKKSAGWDKWTRKSRDGGNDEEDVEDCFLSPFPVDLGSRFLITFLRDPSIRLYALYYATFFFCRRRRRWSGIDRPKKRGILGRNGKMRESRPPPPEPKLPGKVTPRAPRAEAGLGGLGERNGWGDCKRGVAASVAANDRR